MYKQLFMGILNILAVLVILYYGMTVGFVKMLPKTGQWLVMGSMLFVGATSLISATSSVTKAIAERRMENELTVTG